MWPWAGVDGWVGPEEDWEEDEGGGKEGGGGRVSSLFANVLVKKSHDEQRLDSLPALPAVAALASC